MSADGVPFALSLLSFSRGKAVADADSVLEVALDVEDISPRVVVAAGSSSVGAKEEESVVWVFAEEIVGVEDVSEARVEVAIVNGRSKVPIACARVVGEGGVEAIRNAAGERGALGGIVEGESVVLVKRGGAGTMTS